MQKTLNKGKASSRNSKDTSPTPVLSKATTRNKEKALNNIIGMWAEREETKDTKAFRQALWRKETN